MTPPKKRRREGSPGSPVNIKVPHKASKKRLRHKAMTLAKKKADSRSDNMEESLGHEDETFLTAVDIPPKLRQLLQEWMSKSDVGHFQILNNRQIEHGFEGGRAALLDIAPENSIMDLDINDLAVRASETVLWSQHVARFAAPALEAIMEPEGHPLIPDTYISTSPNLRFVLVFKTKALATEILPHITAELPDGASAFTSPKAFTLVTALDSCLSKLDGRRHLWRKLRFAGLVFFAYAHLDPNSTTSDHTSTMQLPIASSHRRTSGSQFNPINAPPILTGNALSGRVAETPLVKTDLPSTSRLQLSTSGSNSNPINLVPGPLSSQPLAVKTELPLMNDRVHLIQLMLSSEERQLQSRYFGRSKDGDAVRCLTCGEDGHMSEKCYLRTCEHCGALYDHFSAACKSVQKCTRCREKGHSSDACPSKLMRSNQADGLACDRCRAKGHGEDKCPNIWRTYLPEKKASSELKLASRMIISCYQCGSNTHWGDDCPMRPRNVLPNSNIFSQKYAAHFLKPSAAATEVVDLTNDADDDDLQFVLQRERHQPAARPGGIQMGIMSNAGSQPVRQQHGAPGTESYRPSNGHGGDPWRSAPPLPNEPPPVLLGSYSHAPQPGPPGTYAPNAYTPYYGLGNYPGASNAGHGNQLEYPHGPKQ